MKKKNLIYLLLILFIAISSSILILYKPKVSEISNTKLKGDVSGVSASARISCDSSTLEINSTTNCTLYGTLSDTTNTYSVATINGLIDASNLEVVSVTGNKSIFSSANDGVMISYIANPSLAPNNEFIISNITLKATNAGTGSVNFKANSRGLYFKVAETGESINVSSSSTNITINSPAPVLSSENRLSSLNVSGANIGTFNQDTINYSATVANSVSSISISGTTVDSKASVSGFGTKSLNVGLNIFTILVTAENNTTKTYSININREAPAKSSVNTLSNIIVTNNGNSINIGTFSPSKTSYSANVENSINNINIAATATDSKATITGDIGSHNLPENLSVFTIKVTAENGSAKNYTISIRRAASSNSGNKSSVNTLSSLSVSNTNINTKFYPNVYVYSAIVDNSVTSVNITATATDPKAVVSGTGTKQLTSGTNSINIIVTAEDGSKKVYSISIKKNSTSSKSNSTSTTTNGNNSSNTNTNTTTPENKKDSNALLKELVINSNNISLSDDNFTYNYTVLYKVKELVIKATPVSSKSEVTITGEKDLIVGKNTVIITVDAEDGTQKIYLINVTRKDEEEELSADSSLNTLSIVNYNLDFDSTKYTYNLKIKNEKQLDILFTPTNENSNVIITGNDDLKNGSVVSIIVTAEDGTTSKYLINIKKSGTGKIIIIIILSILLLGTLGFIYYFFVLRKKKNKTVEEPVEINSFSNEDVYNEYVKNTTIPTPSEDINTDSTESDTVTQNNENIENLPIQEENINNATNTEINNETNVSSMVEDTAINYESEAPNNENINDNGAVEEIEEIEVLDETSMDDNSVELINEPIVDATTDANINKEA